MASFKSLRPAKLETKRATVDKRHEVLPVPPRLSNLDFWQTYEAFSRADFDGNGTLEEFEFGNFVNAQFSDYAGQIDIPQLYAMVDKDNSGDISIEEFLAWIYSVPRTKHRKDVSLKRVSSSPSISTSAGSPRSPLSPKSNFSSRHEPASPTSPKTPKTPTSPTSANGRPSSSSGDTFRRTGELTFLKQRTKAGPQIPEKILQLQFTIGPDFHTRQVGKVPRDASRCDRLKMCMREQNGDSIDVSIIVDPNAKGCDKVMALMGSGICLWNHSSMMPYREDPFQTLHSVESWVRKMTKIFFPLLTRVMNL